MDAQTFFSRSNGDERQPAVRRRQGRAEKLKSLGVEPGKPFDIGADPGRGGLEKAVADILGKIAEKIPSSERSGWILFRRSAVTAPDYETRAGVAFMGLGANMREGAIYPTAYLDGSGNPLDRHTT